ncbi:MAG: Na(+)-translocating NADH-quinone reductase subunit A [Deltaproteobacteria bacterium]|nr:Na(+)-translocating NADH-quinone reductase subunit A [Deltaproteobacteria bacterium]
MIKIRRGLDVPVLGAPAPGVEPGPSVHSVALMGADSPGLRPSMAVEVGDCVALGQLLYTDRRNPDVRYTSPGSGTVVAIHRGAKRRFESIVIGLGGSDEVSFERHRDAVSREAVRDALVESGLWTALRQRPFGRVPSPSAVPHAIFVAALDTRPLAADPLVFVEGRTELLARGIDALTKLTDGPVHVCCRPHAALAVEDNERVRIHAFEGPHPAGLPGTHIHHVDPVSAGRSVWYVDCQEVVAIGQLLSTGHLLTERLISIAGPAVERPGLVTTRLAASVADLLTGRLIHEPARVIAGSVLDGRTAEGTCAYLGRHHRQVSVISDTRSQPLLGSLRPGTDRFSLKRVFASALLPRKRFAFTTVSSGEPGPILPIGSYERVMPLDLLPTPLLKALAIGDIDRARDLGALELEEEDLALCSFVDPGKHEFGALLRNVLQEIQREEQA